MANEDTKKIVIKNFPKDLDKRAKAYAKRKGFTFKALVALSLEYYMKKNE